MAAELQALGYIVPGAKIMFIRDQPAEQTTLGGIIIGQEQQKVPQKGTIIAVGQGVLKDMAQYDIDGIDVLMRASFSKYDGHLETIAMLDGDSVVAEFFHPSDLYLMWVDSNPDADFEESGGIIKEMSGVEDDNLREQLEG